jgi:hypothetical protein
MNVGSLVRGGPALLLAAAALFASSCGGPGRKPVFPVRGQIVDRNHKPAAGAQVIFHPADPNYGDLNKPVGKADDKGAFTLTTYTEGDGAPEGEYAVTVTWAPPKRTPFAPEGGDLLKGSMARPEASKICFTVKRGDNEVPAITLPLP